MGGNIGSLTRLGKHTLNDNLLDRVSKNTDYEAVALTAIGTVRKLVALLTIGSPL